MTVPVVLLEDECPCPLGCGVVCDEIRRVPARLHLHDHLEVTEHAVVRVVDRCQHLYHFRRKNRRAQVVRSLMAVGTVNIGI